MQGGCVFVGGVLCLSQAPQALAVARAKFVLFLRASHQRLLYKVGTYNSP